MSLRCTEAVTLYFSKLKLRNDLEAIVAAAANQKFLPYQCQQILQHIQIPCNRIGLHFRFVDKNFFQCQFDARLDRQQFKRTIQIGHQSYQCFDLWSTMGGAGIFWSVRQHLGNRVVINVRRLTC